MPKSKKNKNKTKKLKKNKKCVYTDEAKRLIKEINILRKNKTLKLKKH